MAAEPLNGESSAQATGVDSVDEQTCRTTPLTNAEFDSALRRGTASFRQLSRAHFRKKSLARSDDAQPEKQALYARYRHDLLSCFERKHGAVIDTYWCERVPGASAITERFEVFIVDPATDRDVSMVLDRAEWVAASAALLLSRSDRQILMPRVYHVVTHALAVADAHPGSDRELTSTKEMLATLINGLEVEFRTAAALRARSRYLLGVLLGGAAAVSTLATVLAYRPDPIIDPMGRCAEIALAGSVGAVLSVMMRLTRRTLHVAADRKLVVSMLGAVRAPVGAVFGVALFLLIQSGLLPVRTPVGADVWPVRAFELILGFLSGFNERWAQDTVSSATDAMHRHSRSE